MMKKIKAVIIGFSHMHVNEVALYISEREDIELVAVADVDSGNEQIEGYRYTQKWNLQNVKEKYCNNVYDSYTAMLDEVKPDIAFILCENSIKPIVVEECAKRKIDVSIEKPIAVSLVEALKIKNSVEKYGVKALVNWPVAWRPYIHKFKAVLDSGIVGKPLKLRYINGHTGPLGVGAKHRGVSDTAEEMTNETRSKTWWHKQKYGGGVYLDIACYGCFFSNWLMGSDAEYVISLGKNLNTYFGDTDDNFGAVIEYSDKMSVIEGTWTTPRVVIPSGPMLICEKGVITCVGGAENAPDVKAYDMFGNELEVKNVELGAKFKNMPNAYAEYINNGEEIFDMLTLDKNIEVMALLDACIKSSNSGKKERVEKV